MACSLGFDRDGHGVSLTVNTAQEPVEILRAALAWTAGKWHQVSLAWSEKQTVLYLDGQRVAEGAGLDLSAFAKTDGVFGFCLGSDGAGGRVARGQFEELISFARVCSDAEIAADYQRTAPLAALGPISEVEQAARQTALSAAARSGKKTAAPSSRSAARAQALLDAGDCASELLIQPDTNGVITLTIANAAAGLPFDLFRTYALAGSSITNSFWFWTARGTNGQHFTFTNTPGAPVFYVLGCTNDTDGDGLTDAFETLVTKTSPWTNHSVNALYTDWEMVNVLVNDLGQDCGNEQNSQFETTVAVLGTNVIVAWVDSNRGVYTLGQDNRLTNRTPRFAGYAVSQDVGVTFTDQDAPPLGTNNVGDGGDPVLAVDRASEVVYLVGTSERRPWEFKGLPFWKSTNGGLTFVRQSTIREDISPSDKPWLAVDDWPGVGQHDLYAACTGSTNGIEFGIWFTVATNGLGSNWSVPVRVAKVIAATNAVDTVAVNSPILVVEPSHVSHVVWFERTNAMNFLKTRTITNRGNSLGTVHTVVPLNTTGSGNGRLGLKRSNTAANDDTFGAFPLPVVAVNPATNLAGHLYVAYADKGTNTGDKADIFFVQSTNSGVTWTVPVRVNTVWTNDQWMPVLAVKPDGTQLFMGWYDRRSDTNNSLIDLYGRWASIGTNGTVSFGNEFRISTVSFPPVFAGTLVENTRQGNYDPVYPPDEVDLHWWYSEWPEFDLSLDTYIRHVGEYNGVWSDNDFMHMTWTDCRLLSGGNQYNRRQSDVRFIRLHWL